MAVSQDKFCCETLRSQLDWTCADHSTASDCPDAPVGRTGTGRYGLHVHDGGTSLLEIHFCPWCGARLSNSLPVATRLKISGAR